MRVCFVLGRLGPSGGVRSVLQHARRLAGAHGMELTVAVAEEPPAGEAPPGVELITADEARNREFDVAVATWWRSVYRLFEIPARRRAYFVQNFEERLYRPGDIERLGAALTHDLPLAFITEATWIAEELGELRPDAPCFHVPNGIDKELFAPPAEPPERGAGPLRILIEGSPNLWFKGVHEALAAAALMREPRHLTLVTPERPASELPDLDALLGPLPHAEMPGVYSQAHVLLKLSRVEGVFCPPLEAFHRGTTCVVWPVSGHDEYVEHGVNGIVAGWDDLAATARWLDLLATDAGLLSRLRSGALETARGSPSWDRSAELMAHALEEIAAGPEPASAAGVPELLAEAHARMELLRLEQLRVRRRLEAGEHAVAAERKRAERLEARAAELEAQLAGRLRGCARRLLASRRS